MTNFWIMNDIFAVVRFLRLIILFRYEIWNYNHINAYLSSYKKQDILRDKITQTGCVGIKLAQWLSQRVDLFGPNTIDTFSYFQDTVPTYISDARLKSLPYEAEDIDIISIERIPIGSGSVSQVHRCGTNMHEDTVIKLFHPKIENDLKTNIPLFKIIFGWAHFFFPKLRILNIDVLLEAILMQVDYPQEVVNQIEMIKIMQSLEFVKIPNVFYHNTKMIVQGECVGYTPAEIRKQYPEYSIDLYEKSMIAYFWILKEH